LDDKNFVLEIELFGVEDEITFTLEDLKTKFPKHSITATIQCGGNRRADMNKFRYSVENIFFCLKEA
jgi:sulfite oxidase